MGLILEQLQTMRELIADPLGWTQGENARRSNQARTYINDPEAVCFCLMGAAFRASDKLKLSSTALDQFLQNCFESASLAKEDGDNYISFNDRSTHAEVLELLDYAIRRATELGV